MQILLRAFFGEVTEVEQKATAAGDGKAEPDFAELLLPDGQGDSSAVDFAEGTDKEAESGARQYATLPEVPISGFRAGLSGTEKPPPPYDTVQHIPVLGTPWQSGVEAVPFAPSILGRTTDNVSPEVALIVGEGVGPPSGAPASPIASEVVPLKPGALVDSQESAPEQKPQNSQPDRPVGTELRALSKHRGSENELSRPVVAAPDPDSPSKGVGVPVERMAPAEEASRVLPERESMAMAPVKIAGQNKPYVPEPRSERALSKGYVRETGVPTAATTLSASPLPVANPSVPSSMTSLESFGRDVVPQSMDLPAGPVLQADADEVKRRPLTPARIEQLARPVVNQVAHTITRTGVDGFAEVRLSPEELGRVRLTMSSAEAGITVQITAERSETLDLMRRNIDMLENDLRDQGFENLNFSFGQDGSRDPADDMAEGDDDMPKAAGARADVIPAQVPIVDGRLDIRL